MACSRMPKCRLRPPGSSGSSSPAPLNVKFVLVDGERSAAPPISHGTRSRDGVEHLAGGFARGDAFVVGGNAGKIGVPAGGQFAGQEQIDLARRLRIFLPVGGEGRLPFDRAGRGRAADAVAEMVVDAVRHQELRILGPAVEALGEAHFLLAERIAVRGGGVLLVRRAVADDAVDDDQRRLVVGAAECFYALRRTPR